jgi:hypothetical protein
MLVYARPSSEILFHLRLKGGLADPRLRASKDSNDPS